MNADRETIAFIEGAELAEEAIAKMEHQLDRYLSDLEEGF